MPAVSEHRCRIDNRGFWGAAFGNREDAVRWWADLMAAFGASIPEAVSYAERWADEHGYAAPDAPPRRRASWEVRA